MTQEILLFWLVHLIIGLLIPIYCYFGCCRLNGTCYQETEIAPETSADR